MCFCEVSSHHLHKMEILVPMKKIFLITIILLFTALTVGCKQDPVKEYGEGLLDTLDSSEVAVDQANLRSLKQAVRMYHNEHGQYPNALEDVAGFMSSPVDLNKYQYNPNTGQVTLKTGTTGRYR